MVILIFEANHSWDLLPSALPSQVQLIMSEEKAKNDVWVEDTQKALPLSRDLYGTCQKGIGSSPA